MASASTLTVAPGANLGKVAGLSEYTLPTAPAAPTPTGMSQLSFTGQAGGSFAPNINGTYGGGITYQGRDNPIAPMPNLGNPSVLAPHPISTLTQKPLQAFGSKAITDSQGNSYTALPVANTATYQSNSFGGYGPASAPTINHYAPAGTVGSGDPTIMPNGGVATTDANGNPINNGFSINTSGTVPSSALGTNYTLNDVTGQAKTYADYVKNLANASGYSPAYIQAYKAQQQAQLQNANINNQVNNPQAAVGLSTGDLSSIISRAGAGNALDQANANIALQAQALTRQGDIAGAQALVDAYKPTTVSPGSSLVSPVTGDETYSGLGGYQAVQGIQTVNNLAQNFPDAGILPTDTLQVAAQKAQNAPSFQSRNITFQQLPGGGIAAFNKNQLVTDPNTGQISIISPTQATAANSASAAIKTLTDQQAQIGSQLSIVDNNFPILTGIVQKYKLNNSIPLVNQLQQNVGGTLGQTAVTQLNAVATGLKATIAQIVSRGGQVDDKTRNEANALLPTNVSYSVLQDLYNVVKSEGAGVMQGLNDEIAKQNTALSGAYSNGTPLSSYGSSSTTGNPFAAGVF